jgi:phosphate/sulfate permease
MLDGIAILIYPFIIIPIISIILAYVIEYIREYVLQRQQQNHMEYLSIIILPLNAQDQPPTYETLFL